MPFARDDDYTMEALERDEAIYEARREDEAQDVVDDLAAARLSLEQAKSSRESFEKRIRDAVGSGFPQAFLDLYGEWFHEEQVALKKLAAIEARA